MAKRGLCAFWVFSHVCVCLTRCYQERERRRGEGGEGLGSQGYRRARRDRGAKNKGLKERSAGRLCAA